MTPQDLQAWRRSVDDLTREHLAAALGCSPYTVESWETGRRSIPTAVERIVELYPAKLASSGLFGSLALRTRSPLDWRTKRRLRQVDAAAVVGVSPETWWSYEQRGELPGIVAALVDVLEAIDLGESERAIREWIAATAEPTA